MKGIILILFIAFSKNCTSQNTIKIEGNDSIVIKYVNSNKNVICFNADSTSNTSLIFRSISPNDKACIKVNDYVYLTNREKIPLVNYKEFSKCKGVLSTGGGILVTLDSKYKILSIIKIQ